MRDVDDRDVDGNGRQAGTPSESRHTPLNCEGWQADLKWIAEALHPVLDWGAPTPHHAKGLVLKAAEALRSKSAATGETPRCLALENSVDSNDLRAWRTLARQIERELAEANRRTEDAIMESLRPSSLLSADDGKALILLRQVRDEWYTFTGYSQLKVDIDELLERVASTDRGV